MSSFSRQAEIDSHINKQYEQICFNPLKRETLLRLASNRNKRIHMRSYEGNLLNNDMLVDYINTLY